MPKSDPDSARTLNMLGALALALTDRITAGARKASGLPESSASALVAVMNHPGETVDVLRRTLGLTHSGAVRLVDGLEAAGLVERRRSERDARAVTLWTTARGATQAEKVLRARAALLAPILGKLTAAQTRSLVEVLERALGALTGGPDDARAICRFCEEEICRPQGCPVEKAAQEECEPTTSSPHPPRSRR